MDHPRPLFRLFSSFRINITIFTTNQCEKCLSSLRCWDSNPLPLEYESPPITTRPGLPPFELPFQMLTIFRFRKTGSTMAGAGCAATPTGPPPSCAFARSYSNRCPRSDPLRRLEELCRGKK